jgi:hypothetical protein
MKLIHEYSAAELITDRPSGMRILKEGVIRTNKPHQSSNVDISLHAFCLITKLGTWKKIQGEEARLTFPFSM